MQEGEPRGEDEVQVVRGHVPRILREAHKVGHHREERGGQQDHLVDHRGVARLGHVLADDEEDGDHGEEAGDDGGETVLEVVCREGKRDEAER